MWNEKHRGRMTAVFCVSVWVDISLPLEGGDGGSFSRTKLISKNSLSPRLRSDTSLGEGGGQSAAAITLDFSLLFLPIHYRAEAPHHHADGGDDAY